MAENPSEVLDIGEVVRRSGIKPSTLHVWERHGLVEPVCRAGLRRQYDAGVLERIAVIVLCQRAGFTLGEIAALVAPGGFADGKAQLATKMGELVEARRRLDWAIDGLRHALECPEPDPLRCSGFRRELVDVLPIDG